MPFGHTKNSCWSKEAYQLWMQASKKPQMISKHYLYTAQLVIICHFFGRADNARRGFKKVITLLPNQYTNYDKNLITNVIGFLLSHIHLTDKELRVLEDIKVSLTAQ